MATDFDQIRWPWLRAIQSNVDLPDAAKIVASVLVTQFAHHKTGECSPSFDTIATATGRSKDTAKRAVKALVEKGFLIRNVGRWRGTRSNYTFVSPGKVVPIKGGKSANSGKERGANPHPKGGSTAPSYYKDDPKGYQSGHQVEGSQLLPIECAEIRAWESWLNERGLPTLSRLGLDEMRDGHNWYHVPCRRPSPYMSDDKERECLAFFQSRLRGQAHG